MTIKKHTAVLSKQKNNLLPAQYEEQTPTSLIAMAIEKGAGIDTIERLVALEEKWKASKRKEAYAIDFVKMKPKLPLVIRTKKNNQTGSTYAPLEDINKIVDPILFKHGFATSTKIIAQTDTSVTVQAELWHTGGHVETTAIELPLDDKGMQGNVNKTKIHATSSTVSYGKRITVGAILNISTGDDTDGNTQSKPTANPKDEATLKKKISAVDSRPKLNLIWKQNKDLQEVEWFSKAVEEKAKEFPPIEKIDLP